MGIGHTSPRMLRTDPRLQRVLPEYRVFRFPLYAIYPASRKRSARVQAVVDLLRRSSSSLRADSSPQPCASAWALSEESRPANCFLMPTFSAG